MQEQDVVSNVFVEDNERFADIFNGGFYDGCQVMNPSKLRKLDRTSGTVFHLPGEERVNEAVTKYRDVVKESDFGISRIITAIENQSEIHYAMPVKVMTMDAYGYDQQLAQKRKMHRENKDLQGAEYLSGFAKTDKLKPISTAVIYYGKKPWDGPRSLHDMLNLQGVPQEVIERIPDYPLMILDVRRIKDLDKFQTDVGIVFGFLQNAEDKKSLQKYVAAHQNEFRHVKEDAYNVITELTNSGELSKIKESIVEEGGDVDMCKAIQDMMEDSKNEGKIEGKLEQIVKKVKKNKELSQIAEELEESEDSIRPLYESVLEEAPEYNVDRIYERSRTFPPFVPSTESIFENNIKCNLEKTVI